MAQPFYPRKIELQVGPRKGETVYCLQPHYYGTISTKQVAEQIAQESALTSADVLAVIDRLAYFCQRNMALGYKVKLDGLGTFCNDLITTGSVNTEAEVTAKLIKSVRPAFNAEYTIVNRSFRYALLPEKTEFVRVAFKETDETTGPDTDEEDTPDGEDDGSGTFG